MILNEQQNYPLNPKLQPFCPAPKRSPGNQTTIGKNVFKKQLLEEYKLQCQTRQFLGRYFIRFEKLDQTNVKIGIEGEIRAPEQFVTRFVQCLVQSHMSGYVFIGLKVPLFHELAKVDYTMLTRLELVKCNITNIQPVSWLNSPVFKTIYLTNNFITTINSISKTNFPKFTAISLDQNFITDFRPLTRARMVNHQSQQLINKFYLHAILESFHTGDLTFVFKVENREICLFGEKPSVQKIINQYRMLSKIAKMQKQP